MSSEERAITDAEFVVLDVETTGLEPDWGHRVCEVGLVVIRDGVEIDRYSSLVNPGRSIDPTAARINNLTLEMLADAPQFEEILPQVSGFLEGRILVAYNASFDTGFLRSEYRHAGVPLPAFETIDVMALAQKLLPELRRYPLAHVVKTLGFEFPRQHRALSDAEVTARVFGVLLGKLEDQGIDSVEGLRDITRPTSPHSDALRRAKIDTISAAISQKRRVHLVYRSRNEELTERDVTPIRLDTWAGRAQLTGYCHLRGSERTFNVDAIQDVRPID